MADAREQRATALPSGAAAGPTPQDEVRELRAWKESAMTQLGKADKLKDILPNKYWGWDVYDAAVDYILELRAGMAAKVETAPQPDYAAMQAEIEAFDVEDAWRTSAEWMERLMAIIKKYVGPGETAQPASEEEERKAFEAWAAKHFLRVPVGINPTERDSEGRYKAGQVAVAWIAWQAARSRRKTEARHGQ